MKTNGSSWRSPLGAWLGLSSLLAACSLVNAPADLLEPGGAAGTAAGGSDGVSGSAAGGSGGQPGGGSGAFAGEGPCIGSDCQSAGEAGTGVGGEPSTERVCVPRETVCKDGGTATCNEDGTAYAEEAECEPTQTCANGACVEQQCEPDAKFCSVGTVRQCATDGLSSTEVELCGSGRYCDEESATCKTGTCAPDAPACDGPRATTCNSQGSGYAAGGEVCGASTTCNSGDCKAHVCTPSGKVCSAKSVVTCASDGLSSTITATCTAAQFCDAATTSCKAQVCSPGTATCQGNAVKTCNSEGSGTVTTDCNASQYCDGASTTCKAQVCTPSAVTCDGNAVKTCNADGSASSNKACSGGTPFCVSGVCKPCEPNELRCNGQQPQKCGASGDWANNGAACTGEKACDAEGSLVCTASPTVPGGTFNRANDATAPATLSSFRLDRYEVTVARFRAFVTAALAGYRPASGAGKHTHLNAGKGLAIGASYEAGWDTAWNTELALANLAAWTTELSCHPALATWTQTAGSNEAKPINCVNWWQATAFCVWDGGFLPSDAEWNYAAAGGSEQRPYPWGTTAPGTDSSLSVHNCSYMGVSSCGGVLAIASSGAVAAGDGRWRHSDLSGNIAEWVKDFGLPKPCTDCASPVASGPTARGGYYGSTGATDVATTSRPSAPPDLNNPTIGLRCARLP